MKKILILFLLSSFTFYAQNKNPIPFYEADSLPYFINTKCNLKAEKNKLDSCIHSEIVQKIWKHLSKKKMPYSLNLKNGTYKNYARFTINENGNIENIVSVGDVKKISKEIEKAITKFPKMNPALKNGKPVAIRYDLPYTFTIGM